MNGSIKMIVALCACVALVSAQYHPFGLEYSNTLLGGDFPGSRFNTLSAAGARDPRQNRGPVVFPPSPPGDPSQTSGVVVGASGYGFVPPGQGNVRGR